MVSLSMVIWWKEETKSRLDLRLDLVSSFHQITIDKRTIPLTAFCTPNRLFEWLVRPQGSSASPGWVCEGHQRRHQGPGTRLDHIDNKHLPGIPQDLERVSIILTINIYLYTTCLYDPEYNLRLEGDTII